MTARNFLLAIPFSLVMHLASFTQADAEVRLLTGDAQGNVRQSANQILDISQNGDFVLYLTYTSSLGSLSEDPAGLYLKKLSTGEISTVVDSTSTGTFYTDGSVSGDGRYISWQTSTGSIFWCDMQTGITRYVTQTADGQSYHPVISDDGRYVAFSSLARNLVQNTALLPSNNRLGVYFYDSNTGGISIVSLTSNGAALSTGIGLTQTSTKEFDLSGDGRYVVFTSNADNAHPSRPSSYSEGYTWAYRREIATGTTIVVNTNSSNQVAGGHYIAPRISTDGNRIIFPGSYIGEGNNIPMIPLIPNAGDTQEIYVKDLSNGTVWWATRTINNTPAASDSGLKSYSHSISGDGTVAGFTSIGTNYVPGSTDAGLPYPSHDLFRVDLDASGTTQTTLVSQSNNPSWNVEPKDGPYFPGNGKYIAFTTYQVNQMQGINNTSSAFHQGFGVGDFSSLPSGILTFTDWAASLPSGQRGPNDNPAGDGVPNLVKYFMGMDGNAPDIRYLPVSSVQTGSQIGLTADIQKYLTLEIRVRHELPSGYTWAVHTGEDLDGLSTDTGSAIQVNGPVADGDFDRYLYRFPSSMAAAPRGFMRVKVDAPGLD